MQILLKYILFLHFILFSYADNYLLLIKKYLKNQPFDDAIKTIIPSKYDWSDSSCKFAINSKVLRNVNTAMYNKLTLKYTESELEMLKNMNTTIINIGAGTTGTLFIHDIFCNIHLNALNYDSIKLCNNNDNDNELYYKNRNTTTFLYRNIQYNKKAFKLFNDTVGFQTYLSSCISSNSDKCSIPDILSNVKAMIINIAMKFDSLSDSPIDIFAPELLALNPNLKVVFTLRDPYHWTKKRIQRFMQSTIICNPTLWGNPMIRHPFDLLRCLDYGLKTKKSLNDVLINVNGLRRICYFFNIDIHRVLAYAFIRQNTINGMIYSQVSTNKDANMLPICVFDAEKRKISNDVYLEQVSQFYRPTIVQSSEE